MRALDVRLLNIACFDDLTIDFRSDGSDKGASWVVLLGENGTGKSTILQMIGTTLLGYNQVSAIAGDIDWGGYVHFGARRVSGAVWITLGTELGDTGHPLPPSDCRTTVNLSSAGLGEVSETDVLNILRRPELTGGWFACGYSPWRRLTSHSNQSTLESGAFPTLKDAAKPFRFASLFGDASRVTDVPKWLASLYFRSIHPNHAAEDEKRYQMVRDALLKVMPGIRSIEVTPDQQVLVTDHRQIVPIDRLSDGYRSTLAWAGDVIRRLFDAYPDSPNPLHERGLVLIDEIDLHLHPRWQRTVVQEIRSLFPNLQFIVTTHSPFIAQGLRPKDRIIRLERSGRTGAVVAREDAGDLESWSADQILSSYFGLPLGTRGEQTMKDEARYQRLLDAEANGTLTNEMRATLVELEAKVDKVPIGETPTEEAVFRMAEALGAKLRKQRLDIEARSGDAMIDEVPAG